MAEDWAPENMDANAAYHAGHLKGFNDGWGARDQRGAEARERIAAAEARLSAALVAKAVPSLPQPWEEFRRLVGRLHRERVGTPAAPSERAPGCEVALILHRNRAGEIVRYWPIDASTIIRTTGGWEQRVDGERVGWWDAGDVLVSGRVDQNIAPGMDVGIMPKAPRP